MKRIFVFLMLLCCGFCGMKAEALSAQSAILIDAGSGMVLYEENADAFLPVASTTKILTALITLEQPELDLYFTVDPNAILVEGSSMGLQQGDKVTLRILAAGMLLASGNDAANAAAVRIAGSTEKFAELMNEKAKSLGMKTSYFVTPSGLDENGNGSTAREMALLAAAALENEDFLRICSQSSMKLSYGNPVYDRWLSNHNKLLKSYDGCIGVKTGFTKKAGRCLVSAAERDGVRLVCVTLNAPDDWNDHKTLLDRGFASMEQVTLTPDLSAYRFPVVGGTAGEINATAGSITVSLPKGAADKVEIRVAAAPFSYAPVRKGDVLGEVAFVLPREEGEKVLGTSVITAAEEIGYKPGKDPGLLIKIKRWLRRVFYA